MSAIKVELYKVKEVARILSLSEWEIRRLCKTGELHPRYIGQGRRFYNVTADSVHAYLESLSPEKAEESA